MPLEQVEPIQASPSATPDVQPSGQQAVSQPAPSQPEDMSVIDWARSQGYDLSGHENDEAALRHLLEQSKSYPQLQQLARYGQEVLPQWEQYQQWIRSGAQQVRQAPQPAPQPQAPWSPPISKADAEGLLARWYTRDQNGQIQPRPETPPSVVQKVADYQQYVSDFEARFRHNPVEALQPLVEPQIKQLIQQELQQRQVQDQAMQVVQRHAAWMFQTDQNGVPQYGRYTPQGHRFWQYVQQLEQSGVRDVAQQEYYALSMVQRDMLDAQRQPSQQPVPPQRTPQQPSRAARQPSVTPPAPAVPRGAMSLEQMALQNIRAAGMTVS